MLHGVLGIGQRLKDLVGLEEVRERIRRAPVSLNSAGFDPWGLDPETLALAVAAVRWLYTDYFRVEVAGIERLPQGRVLVIANHGGQIPFDGMLVGLSLILAAEPPRVPRAMAERWFPSLPFISTLFVRSGVVVGDPKNCHDLLARDECVLVFPEGVRGSGKSIFKRYQLQRFGTGFVRLALETRTPIVPCAVIGCEETYPGLANLKPIARLLKVPYAPVTPFFPWLGPLGALPLPCKVSLRYAAPRLFEADPEAPDEEVQAMVDEVRDALQAEIDEGRRCRGGRLFTGSGV